MRRELIAFATACLLASPAARAQTAPAGASAQADPDGLEAAKNLFKRGVVLFEAGQLEEALDHFVRSRAAFASKQNSLNVAITLDKLGRFDAALEAYENALVAFADDLTPEERASIPTVIRGLTTKVALLDVTANVPGSVFIDGRERAKLPHGPPIRVVPGRHLVRVMRDGYRTFEKTIEVDRGGRVAVDARLEPLAAAGGLRIEDPQLASGEVTVDDVVVGNLPWEGTLAPGPHVISSRGEGLGSAPKQAIVLQGQTTLVRLRSMPLGASARIVARPDSAELRLDGVPIGHGTWDSALPVGHYIVEAREPGYFTKIVSIEVRPRGEPNTRADIVLEIDPNDPRWPKSALGHFWIGALAGYAVGQTLGSGAETSCAFGCASGGLASGFLIGIRAGYELRARVSIEAMGGYLSLGHAFTRDASQAIPGGAPGETLTYHIDDIVRLKGPWIGAGVSYRAPLGGRFSLRPRVSGGTVFARSLDPISGSATAGNDSVRVSLEGAGTSVSSTPLFASAELGIEAALGGWHVGGALALFAITNDGPTLPHGDLFVPTAGCTTQNPASVGCARASPRLRDERAYGPFVMLMPQLGFSRVF